MVGLFASYPTNLAPGATIEMVATLCFFLALLFSPRQGFVTTRLRHRQTPAPGGAPGATIQGIERS